MAEEINVPAYLTLLWVFLIVFVVYIIRLYANPVCFSWHSYIAIFLAYFCSIGLLLIVPLDVSLTVIGRRSYKLNENYEDNSSTLVTIYTCFFLPAAILGGFIMILQEQYLREGHFSVMSRIYATFRTLGMQTVAGIIIGAILFGVLVGEKVVKPDAEALLLTIVLISNTCYLIILMIFMGYGLVAFPIHLWEKGDLRRELSRVEQKAAYRFKTLGEANINMGMAVADVLKTEEALETSSNSALKAAVKVLVKECPQGFSSSTLGKVAIDSNKVITINSLAKLRGRLYYVSNAYMMAQGKVEEAKVNAYKYEDIIRAMGRQDGVRRIQWSFTAESSEAEFMWEVTYKPVLYRVGSVVAVFMSLFSYLGILGTMPNIARVISVYHHAVHNGITSGLGICVFVLFTLLYTTYVAMWSIFQMRIADIMELLPGRKTSPISLSVNARVCAKFAAPLCFFYLGWIFENGIRTGAWTEGADGSTHLTAFARFYQIQVIPVIGDSFNLVFPVIIFGTSALVATNTINRLLVFLKLEKFQFGSEILTDDQLREGRRQLARHKRLMERSARRSSLKARIELARGGGASVVVALPTSVKSLFSPFFCWRIRERDVLEGQKDLELVTVEEEDVLPNNLKGWGERKDSSMRGFRTWQRRYLVTKEPGTLFFYSDAEMEKEMEARLNLHEVITFLHLDGKDNTTVRIELPDTEINLRFQTVEDAAVWALGLDEWKEYASLHQSLALCSTAEQLDLSDLCSFDEESGQNVSELTTFSAQEAVLKSLDTVGPDSAGEVCNRKVLGLAKSHQRLPPPMLVTCSEDLFQRPDPLEGWLEKKQGAIVFQWQRLYCRVLPSTLELACYCSDRIDEKAMTTIDLRHIMSVDKKHEGESIDSSRFHIETQEGDYYLKAMSHEEGERWVNGLLEWRDFALFSVE